MGHKLTKSFVDGRPFVTRGQVFYRDSELKGFGLRVGTSTKTYIAESKVNGQVVRYSIGKHGVYTPEQARAEAREKLLLMSKGINPNDVKAEKKAKGVTVKQAFEGFKSARRSLKTRTVADYERIMDVYLPDWHRKSLSSITKDMVAKRHEKLSGPWQIEIRGEVKTYKGSPAQANLTMRFLRALFNFAAGQYEDSLGHSLFPENPVKRLSQTKSWHRIERRRTVIKQSQLEQWVAGVLSLRNDETSQKREILRDYLLLLIFTGLRRQEAARLAWDKVDFKARTLTVTDTKNHIDHTLPLSDFLVDLLRHRREQSRSKYVFPGDGKTGHIVEPRKQMSRVTQYSGLSFTLHDLRRTFITIAESLDIPAYALKQLVNHKNENDVTAGYVVADVERLRAPMQKITDHILKCAKVKPTAVVIPLGQKPRRSHAHVAA